MELFFSDLGPGLITGCADDAPSGISTYSIAGAAFAYGLLWTALASFPMMTAVQLMCGRLAMNAAYLLFTFGLMGYGHAGSPSAGRIVRLRNRGGGCLERFTGEEAAEREAILRCGLAINYAGLDAVKMLF